MLEFILASENTPFMIALLVMLIIGFLEGAGMLFGAGLSDIVSGLMPDVDADMDVDIDAGVSADVSASNALSKILSWLRVGKVPVIVLLVIFLTAFGLGGLYLQNVMDDMFGYLLPSAVASGIAICIALPITRFCGGIVERIIPKDETDAVSVKTLIGRVATILVGTAATDSSAEAKVKDQHGQTHYIMVQPDADEETFTAGDDVLLVRKAGSVFYVIKNTNMNLSDEG